MKHTEETIEELTKKVLLSNGQMEEDRLVEPKFEGKTIEDVFQIFQTSEDEVELVNSCLHLLDNVDISEDGIREKFLSHKNGKEYAEWALRLSQLVNLSVVRTKELSPGKLEKLNSYNF